MSTAARRSRTRDASGILYQYGEGVRRISQRDAVNLVHDVEADARFLGVNPDEEFTARLPALPTPASGEPYDDCGDEQPLLACSRCGHPVEVSRRCRRALCPSCWESWDKKQAVEICAKINGRQRWLNSGPGSTTWMHHVIVSPPPEYRMRSGQPLDRTKEAVKQIMGEGGSREGAIVYHSWRIKKEHRGDVLGHDSGSGNLTWKDIIGMIERNGWDEVAEEYLVYEPHFHVFCLTSYFHMDTDGFEEKGGWVVHRVEDDDGASVRELDDLCRAVGYSLSHAGLRSDGRGASATYWYFGEVTDFQPTAGVRADTERAFDSIAQKVLGVTFPSRRCSASASGGRGHQDNHERGDREHDLAEPQPAGITATPEPRKKGATENTPAVSISRGSGGGTGRAPDPTPVTYEPVAIDTSEDKKGGRSDQGPDDGDECGGRLISMREADGLLADEDWCAAAPHVDELREAYTEWLAIEAARDRPPPDPPPS